MSKLAPPGSSEKSGGPGPPVLPPMIQTVLCYRDRSGLKCVLHLEGHSYFLLSKEYHVILYQVLFLDRKMLIVYTI